MNWINRKWFLNIITFLIILLLSIKLFDLTVGLFQDSSAIIQSNQTTRSLILKENRPQLISVFEIPKSDTAAYHSFNHKKSQLRTDIDGFILGPKDFTSNDKNVSIIFFGGSTTECAYVEEEKRFPYLVSEKLGIRVLNGGVSGNHSMHSLLSMIGKGIPQKPKHVVLMHAVNDLSTLSKTLSYWKAPDSRSLIQTGNAPSHHSSLYKIARAAKNYFVPNTWQMTRHIFLSTEYLQTDEWAIYRNDKIKSSDIEHILIEQFTASLKSFVHLSRSWNIEPILMTQFNRLKSDDSTVRAEFKLYQPLISYDEFIGFYAKTNDLVRMVAKDDNVFLIDLDSEIPPTSEYIYDSVHLTTIGSELVAEKISTALKARYPTIYR